MTKVSGTTVHAAFALKEAAATSESPRPIDLSFMTSLT